MIHRALAVAAGDEHRGRTERVELLGEHATILGVDLAERLSLVEVRRDHGRERKEQRDERLDGIVLEQLRAGGGDHDRIDDERHRMLGEERRHRLHDLAREEHPRLRRVDADVREDRLQLRLHELGATSCTEVTPTVFCAVSATIALIP